MKLIIKRSDTSLPMPEYKNKGAVGIDLCARVNVKIKTGKTELVPLNVIVKPPKGYWVLLAARSSLFKWGLLPVNGIGIIDPDYSGEEDELKLSVLNFTKKTVLVKKGERVAQMTLMKINKARVSEVKKMKKKSRGGFGTTGK